METEEDEGGSGSGEVCEEAVGARIAGAAPLYVAVARASAGACVSGSLQLCSISCLFRFHCTTS
jgi:hypothetical protein